MKDIRKEYDKFVRKNGQKPVYAEVKIQFRGEDSEETMTMKFREFSTPDPENDPEDNQIFYYPVDIDNLMELTKTDNKCQDFTVTDLIEFSI